ncbi:nostrin-like [Uloborus diversus]|uniref:nostrin-like n=1 Tax=Uloborus diversus TaxID=327109 RepID=UPI002409CA41|nr:nostrin-like [Uloborus diversus]
MSFQDCFWGPNGFEELRKAIKEGQDFTKDITAILHERSELEINYAKGLSKLATKINKATKLTVGTSQSAWQEVALQMENEADVHRHFSSGLEDDVVKPMKVLLDCQHKQRKIVENSVDKISKVLNDKRNDELKAKKLSYVCARENERMQEQALDCKVNKGKLLTEKDIHKLEHKKRKAEELLNRADIDYYNACIKAERTRQDWETSVYRANSAFQQLEEERLNSMHDFVQKYTNNYSLVGPALIQCSERLSTTVKTVDVTADVQKLIETRGTGPNIPEQYLPDFYAEGINNEMKRERRKEILQRFLNLLKHDLELERKGKQGVENLAKVFQETPTFGDADAQQDVFEKLQHMRAMLTYLEATRFKMQCTLAEIEGRNKPTHPLFAHMEVKNKQGMNQTVLKVPHWVRMERRNSGSSGSGSSDSPDFEVSQIQDNGNDLYANLPTHSNGISSMTQCRAMYDYEAKLTDELTLHPGDIITMVQKTDDGWWQGELNGVVGVFPSTYVEEL